MQASRQHLDQNSSANHQPSPSALWASPKKIIKKNYIYFFFGGGFNSARGFQKEKEKLFKKICTSGSRWLHL
jgi:hypothetical protein